MGMIKIPKKSIDYFYSNVSDIFETGFLAEGKWNKKLSELVKNITGVSNATPTNSNGAGIVALLTIYRHIYKRTKVLVQSNTMYGVKVMVPAAGCENSGYIGCQINTLMPSFVDVKQSVSRFSKKDRKELIIILSHIGGIINPDIEKISAYCLANDVILIEDCAHSFGATLFNKHSGLFGNAGVYSFYATKAIPAGEGGMVVTHDDDLGKIIEKYVIYDRFDQKLQIGSNIRISEIQALFTYSVAKEWNEIILNKEKISKEFKSVCIDRNIQYIDQTKNGQNGNYYKFVVYHDKTPIKDAYPHLNTLTSSVYDYCLCNCNHIISNHACLPIWYGQEKKITDKVVLELSKS